MTLADYNAPIGLAARGVPESAVTVESDTAFTVRLPDDCLVVVDFTEEDDISYVVRNPDGKLVSKGNGEAIEQVEEIAATYHLHRRYAAR